MAVLETLVRQLAAGGVHPPAQPAPSAPPLAAPPPPASPPVATQPASATILASPGPGRQPAAPRPARPRTSSALASEKWIGQRVFLGIGVVALLVAAGYLLKLSFERGWISPITRCAGGVFAGVCVGALGWRLEPRYRTYGAALVGAGAGIIYLSIWAASRLYGVLPSASGIVGLALVSVALAMIALAINVEALGITAALGAFFAPVLLGQNQNNADLLLLYLASMATGLGLVSARRRWRIAGIRDRRQLFRGRHRRRGRPRQSLGAAPVRADRRHRRTLRGLARAVVGDPSAHLLGWLDPARGREPPSRPALGGAGRRARALGADLVARAPAAPGVSRYLGPRGQESGWAVGEALYFFVTSKPSIRASSARTGSTSQITTCAPAPRARWARPRPVQP